MSATSASTWATNRSTTSRGHKSQHGAGPSNHQSRGRPRARYNKMRQHRRTRRPPPSAAPRAVSIERPRPRRPATPPGRPPRAVRRGGPTARRHHKSRFRHRRRARRRWIAPPAPRRRVCHCARYCSCDRSAAVAPRVRLSRRRLFHASLRSTSNIPDARAAPSSRRRTYFACRAVGFQRWVVDTSGSGDLGGNLKARPRRLGEGSHLLLVPYRLLRGAFGS